ncbi:hypothetical protein F53441_3696 [Fusarium austroafricanum]|uniref:RING-type domain-containing protein n=1 Tax=Fusarium austroafricanum TaxID=2364996 RepID=A0A8H4KNX0_9HYPO|nr:hypothetical protein F53441_3696 [Fusarium austroafricanum]
MNLFKKGSKPTKIDVDASTRTDIVTNTYWPDFLSAAKNPKTLSFRLTCSICDKVMLATSFKKKDLPPEGPFNDVLIQPCGHMVCFTCFEESISNQEAWFPEQKWHECPICSTEIKNHPVCGHPCKGMILPVKTADWYLFPPVLSHGGVINNHCLPCEMARVLDDLEGYETKYEYSQQIERPSQFVLSWIHDPVWNLYNEKPGLYKSKSGGLGNVTKNTVATPGANNSLDLKERLSWRVRDLEIPKEVESLWEAHKQTWILRQNSFWFSPAILKSDCGPSLCISVMDSKPPNGEGPSLDTPELRSHLGLSMFVQDIKE